MSSLLNTHHKDTMLLKLSNNEKFTSGTYSSLNVISRYFKVMRNNVFTNDIIVTLIKISSKQQCVKGAFSIEVYY